MEIFDNHTHLPKITFTDTSYESETNSTDDIKLNMELNNNTENLEQYFEDTDTEDNLPVKRADKTLTERIKDLGSCIRWLKTELVSVFSNI